MLRLIVACAWAHPANKSKKWNRGLISGSCLDHCSIKTTAMRIWIRDDQKSLSRKVAHAFHCIWYQHPTFGAPTWRRLTTIDSCISFKSGLGLNPCEQLAAGWINVQLDFNRTVTTNQILERQTRCAKGGNDLHNWLHGLPSPQP